MGPSRFNLGSPSAVSSALCVMTLAACPSAQKEAPAASEAAVEPKAAAPAEPQAEPAAQEALADEGERRVQSAAASLVGEPAPVQTLTTIDGERIDLGALYGAKPVYLKFWATWCVPCREQMPRFKAIAETHGEQIEVIAVNTGFSDTAEAAREYRDEMGLQMPIAIDDGSLARALNLRVTPQHVLIGRDGRIAHVGHLDDAKLDEALKRVLAKDGGAKTPVKPQEPDPEQHYTKGDRVDALTMDVLAGTTVTVGEKDSARPAALVFFAPWCESYLEESQSKTSQACRRVRESVEGELSRGDLDWVGISSGLWVTEKDIQDYRAETGSRLPVVLDESGQLFRTFDVRQIPTVVLIDSKGRVAEILGRDDEGLEAAIRHLGAPSPLSQTQE